MKRLVLLALALASLAACRSPGSRALPQPRRIILLSMDTVRADRVSGFGDADTTPNLRAIAGEGARFTRFYAAAGYTLPAHMSIFTGRDVMEHGVQSIEHRLAEGTPTLGTLLHEAGYATRGFHEGFLVAGKYGFEAGFDAYRAHPHGAVIGEALGDVLSWMESMADRPYFLFLHTYAAHHPFGGTARYRRDHPERGLPSDDEIAELRRRYAAFPKRGKKASLEIPLDVRALCTLLNYLVEHRSEVLACGDTPPSTLLRHSPHYALDLAAIERSYEAGITRIDRAVGEIRHALVSRGQWDDTLLVVTADHGEAFDEHGLIGHGYVPFEEVLRVPLVLSFPRLLPDRPGQVVQGLAWHLDLLPTILSLAGAAAPPDLRGVDLTSALTGDRPFPADRAIFPTVVHTAQRRQKPLRKIVLQGDDKFIEGHRRFGAKSGLLFDLGADPGERTNLLDVRKERAGELTTLVRRHRQELASSRRRGAEKAPAIQLSPAEIEDLRGLGYVQ